MGLALLAGVALAALPSLARDGDDGFGKHRGRHKVKLQRGDRDTEDFDRDDHGRFSHVVIFPRAGRFHDDDDDQFDRDDHGRFSHVVIFPRVGRFHDDDDDQFDRDDDSGRLGRIVVFPHFRGSSGRPPGWDRGRKVGWGHCDVPPGQAKKVGCRHIFFGRHGRPQRIHRPVVVFEP